MYLPYVQIVGHQMAAYDLDCIDKIIYSNNFVHTALSAIPQYLSEFCMSLLFLGIGIRVDKPIAAGI